MILTLKFQPVPMTLASSCALGFKLWSDKFGRLSSSVSIQASVKKGDTIYNPRTRKTERVGRLIQIQAASTRISKLLFR
jgi:elongation factor G